MRLVLACGVALALIPRAAGAQNAQPVYSMGQPPLWPAHVSAEWSGGGEGLLVAGVRHAVLNPVDGLLSAGGEGYAMRSAAGARLLAAVPALGFSLGIDWRSGRGVAPVASFQSAIRRGGLLGDGTMLRVDWRRGGDHGFGIGIDVPLGQPLAGRTRPRRTAVRLPGSVPDRSDVSAGGAEVSTTAQSALAVVDSSARLLRAYTNIYSRDNERLLAGSGTSYQEAAHSYETALERAFAAAAGDSTLGRNIARRARAGLLVRVLIPYDSLFGQPRTGGIGGLTADAQGVFARWLSDSSSVPAERRGAVLAVHAGWLTAIERVDGDLRSQWKDSRLVWLPLQLALTSSEYDRQSEADSIVGRFVGHPFTDDNALTLLRSADLPLEIARSIYAAREYHVLWTHDITGRLPSRAVDMVGYAMVADAYLPALTAAVQRYDSAGHLPVYMILLDEYFYEPRDGRLWMTILEDPLNANVGIRGLDAAHQAHLRDRQQELRRAIAASRRLQADAAKFGASWLRRTVKVHVNINLPADFSFRSERILPPVPFTPDNVMRDHRKIVLYDVNEADPYRGAMLIMGVGVGEQYASADWEDRGYRISGPVALEARAALRRQLLREGFGEDRIPAPLLPVRSPRAVEHAMNLGAYAGRAVQVHNEPGFGAKQSSVARAVLYDLAPPGSIIIVPDPLWLSQVWAAMLAGAAARGCRVYVIAPAAANAASPQAPLMAQEHDVMLRLLDLRTSMANELRESGGELRVGLFTARAAADDAVGRAREVREGLSRYPWIRDLVPFDDRTLAVLDNATRQTAADGADARTLAPHEQPKIPLLHSKTQFIARPGAIAALVRQPGWDVEIASAMRVQSAQTTRFAEQLGWTHPDVDTAATRRADAMLRGYEHSLSPAERERVSFHYSVGSQNEDPRGLMLDAESTVIVSGFDGAVGLVDLYFLMARSTWVESQQQLEQLVPAQNGLMRRIGSNLRDVF